MNVSLCSKHITSGDSKISHNNIIQAVIDHVLAIVEINELVRVNDDTSVCTLVLTCKRTIRMIVNYHPPRINYTIRGGDTHIIKSDQFVLFQEYESRLACSSSGSKTCRAALSSHDCDANVTARPSSSSQTIPVTYVYVYTSTGKPWPAYI